MINKIKLQENVEDYNAGNSIFIWDNAFDPKMFPAQNEMDFNFSNRSGQKGPGIISWVKNILNWDSDDGSLEETIAKVEKEYDGAVEKYPFLDQSVQLIHTLAGPNFKMLRGWFNGQTFGLGDDIHRDVQLIDQELGQFVTFIFFCNHVWENEWGGETLIYDPNYDALGAITPRPGRMVAFDSRLLHKGHPPARHIVDLRLTFALHTFLEKPIKGKDGK
tara:strand:+ start:1602 stop:2258 length:657 start_codon:yes stop_codon:yes gene_type:complete